MKLRQALKCTWGLLALSPTVTVLQRGVETRFVVSAMVYALGWMLLQVALAHDPSGQRLRTLGRSGAARVAGVGILLLFLVLGFELSASTLLLLFTVVSVSFIVLWIRCRSGETLTRAVENVLLMVASVTFLLIVGEAVFRLPPVVARTGGNTPGMARWVQKNYDSETDYRRFRSLHLDKPKPDRTFRVLTLGDSMTWGDKIAHTKDIWPYVLEKMLRQKERPVQVINLAKCGYTTVNEAETLESIGWSFEPDIVILQFTLNDTLPSGPNLQRVSEEWFFRTRPLSPIFHRALDRHSYLYSFLNAQVRSLQMRSRYSDGYAPLYADNFDGWRACQAALREMAEKTRKRGVPMLVVIFPYFTPGKMDNASYPYLKIHQKVAAAAKEAGLPVLDLRPVYARFGREGRSWWALPCDGHPNVEGHRVAGEAIVKKIEELGFLAAKR